MLPAYGYEFVIIRYNKSYAIIEGEEIEFRIREKLIISDKKTDYGSRILEKTGQFVFGYGSWTSKQVKDGQEKIESKLAIIIAKLGIEGNKLHKQCIEREKRQREYEEKRRIEEELKARKENEFREFVDLYNKAIQVHHAKILRNYVDDLSNHSNNIEAQSYINWAAKKIDWYDPFIGSEDALLDESFKARAFNEFKGRSL